MKIRVCSDNIDSTFLFAQQLLDSSCYFRWFCHFDDDNYVNVPRLVETLDQFDPRQDWYLGKPSLPEPLEIPGDRDTATNTKVALLFRFLCLLPKKYAFLSDPPDFGSPLVEQDSA